MQVVVNPGRLSSIPWTYGAYSATVYIQVCSIGYRYSRAGRHIPPWCVGHDLAPGCLVPLMLVEPWLFMNTLGSRRCRRRPVVGLLRYWRSVGPGLGWYRTWNGVISSDSFSVWTPCQEGLKPRLSITLGPVPRLV